MRTAYLLWLALAVSAGCARTESTPAPVEEGVPTAAYVNGRWWNGEAFVEQTVYVIGDTIAGRVPARVDREIDLTGAWVIPPFGEAHNHHFDVPAMVEDINQILLQEGVFYAMSLTNWADVKQQVLPFWGRTETVDVAFSDLGLTAPWGHPALIYENLARNQFTFDGTQIELYRDRRAEGRAYLLFDSEDDVERQWPQVLSSGPDLVKIYLVRTDDWAELARDTSRFGNRGLHPEVAAAIVQRAHADGLRVAAHVETARDFGLAVDMGVDIIAHLPGYSITRGRSAPEDTVSYRISEADARRAAERGVVVIPTPLVPPGVNPVSEWARDFQAGQLGRLHLAGVPLVIGSDTYGGTPLPEVTFLQSLDVFSHAELLEMWGRRTAEVIFPGDRKSVV